MKKLIANLLIILIVSLCVMPNVSAKTIPGQDHVVLVLDPGHGAHDSGAYSNGICEKDINMTIAKIMKEELDKYYGVEIYLTHDDSVLLDREERAEVAAGYNADLLISIHANSSTSSYVNGSEVYYPNANYISNFKSCLSYPEVKQLAQNLQNGLVDVGLKDNGIRIRNSENGSIYDDGSRADYYGIICHPKNLGIPSILIEHGYMSNKHDLETFLNSDAKLRKMAMSNVSVLVETFDLSTQGVLDFSVTAPQKTEYIVGEQFDSKGLTVKVKYADGTAKTLNSDEYKITGFDSSKTGNKVVTVEYIDQKLSFFCCILPESADVNSKIIGDVNGDGVVKASDYLIIKDSILKDMPLSDAQMLRADVREDGIIKASDYLIIKDYFLGKLDHLREPEVTATPVPTAEPSATPEPTAEPSATPEPTAQPSETPEPTAEPSETPEPTIEPSESLEPSGTLTQGL